MKKVLIILIAVLIVGAVVFALVKANSKSGDTMSGMNMSSSSTDAKNPDTSSQAVATDKVSINDFAFSPQAITVSAGTTVTWTNKDSAEHTVTSDDASSDGPNSQQLAQGASYTFTFATAGTYKYHCANHPNMTGTVIVK